MNKLIKNELTKIFKKKSIYITLFVILAFVILTNCIYKFFYQGDGYHEYNNKYIEYINEEIKTLDPNKPSDTKLYVDLKSELDLYEMKQKYEEDAWQRTILSTQIAEYVHEKNTYSYGENKDLEKADEVEKKMQDIIQKLEKDDWKYFAREELEQAKIAVNNFKEQRDMTKDKQELQSIELMLENAKIDEQVANYRLDKEIKYGNDYRNRALRNYQEQAKNVLSIDYTAKDLSYQEKQQYNESVSLREINKYVIENEVDVNKSDDVRGILKNFFSEYGLFVVVMIIMIAGTIVSEEFNKGTIKLLLVKPYSRNKILFSKFITILIMIIFSIFAVVVMELLIGGVIFGYDSLSVPILEYNFETGNLETLSIFTYLGIEIVTQLPKLVLLATLAFSFSTLFTNGPVAIAIPLLGYMSADVINMLVIQKKVDFMRFFVSLNWDFSEYLYGNLPSMEGMTIQFSIIMCMLYFIAMIIPTFIVFKKKNIKNI